MRPVGHLVDNLGYICMSSRIHERDIVGIVSTQKITM